MYAVKDKTWWAGIGTLTHSPLGAFCGIRSSLIFLAGGGGTYQTENIMFPFISWER